MVEVTPAKRVLPARERRESAAKRYSPAPPTVTRRRTASKAATPSTPATEEKSTRKNSKRAIRTPTPPKAPTPPVEDTLPTKLTSSKSLPVTKQKQASALSTKDYQTIADSAILAASLHRSRMQWLSDGIFKRYWVKPVKRKGVVEQPPDNPDAKSMVKLGDGTITAEPHKFNVTFYTVKESGPLPGYKHPNQHTPKPSASPYPMAPPYTPYKPTTPANSTGPTGPSPPPPQHSPPVKQESHMPPTNPAPLPAAGNPPVQQTIQTPPAAPKTNSDPVIQMLAARAATDQRLKDLMKVVATSKANAEQLKEFQRHIDEFNAVVKQQESDRLEREKQAKSSPSQQVPQQSGSPATPTQPVQYNAPPPVSTGTKSLPPPPNTPVATTPGAAHPSVYHTTAPRPPPPSYPAYAPPRPVEAYIKHIIVEFHGDNTTTDRFLFPAYAALDLQRGGLEMTASFFVEREGSEMLANLGECSVEETAAAQAKWKTNVDYYQPVTIVVRASMHKTIETIARAAKTLPEVQDYMKEVLAIKTWAPTGYLVHQLPREKGVAGSEVPADLVDSGVEMGSSSEDEHEDDELKPFYGNL